MVSFLAILYSLYKSYRPVIYILPVRYILQIIGFLGRYWWWYWSLAGSYVKHYLCLIIYSALHINAWTNKSLWKSFRSSRWSNWFIYQCKKSSTKSKSSWYTTETRFQRYTIIYYFTFLIFFISYQTWKIGEPNNNRHIQTYKTGQSNFAEFRCWIINFQFNNFESTIWKCNHLNKSNITKFSSEIKRIKA